MFNYPHNRAAGSWLDCRYYWLRTTTINHNVDESMFQKWERNWEAVVADADQFFKEWLLKNR